MNGTFIKKEMRRSNETVNGSYGVIDNLSELSLNHTDWRPYAPCALFCTETTSSHLKEAIMQYRKYIQFFNFRRFALISLLCSPSRHVFAVSSPSAISVEKEASVTMVFWPMVGNFSDLRGKTVTFNMCIRTVL